MGLNMNLTGIFDCTMGTGTMCTAMNPDKMSAEELQSWQKDDPI